MSADPKVRSIAITSPVAFIWLPRVRWREGTCRTGSAALDDQVVEAGSKAATVVPVTTLGISASRCRPRSGPPPWRWGSGGLAGQRGVRLTRGFTSMTRYSRSRARARTGRCSRPRRRGPDDRQRGAAEALVNRVGQVLDGSHDDGVAGVDPQRVAFSIEQTAMHVSSASRITSTRSPANRRGPLPMTWPMGLARRPARTRSR